LIRAPQRLIVPTVQGGLDVQVLAEKGLGQFVHAQMSMVPGVLPKLLPFMVTVVDWPVGMVDGLMLLITGVASYTDTPGRESGGIAR